MKQPIYHLSKNLAYDVFSNFTENTAQAILIVDLQPIKILYINPVARELWDVGKQSQSVDLQHLIHMIHHEDRGHALDRINGYCAEMDPTAWSSG